MKILLVLLLTACASKYEIHPSIDKRSFALDKENTSMAPRAVKGQRETSSFCAGQFLFMSNAKKETDKSIPKLLSRTCPKKVFLLDAKVTETWWTTIIYSRSCVKIEAYCPREY